MRWSGRPMSEADTKRRSDTAVDATREVVLPFLM